MKIVVSQGESIEKLLKSNYYEIPRFQRPYSWKLEEINDFWNDVIEENKEKYFNRGNGRL